MATLPVTDMNFEEQVLKSSQPVLVDFWAEWCGPCRALASKLEEISCEMEGKLTVVKINIDENPNAPAKYGVKGIPTMVLFKDGQEVDQVVGNQSKNNIMALLKKHV